VRIVQLANFHTPTSGGLRVAVDTLRSGYLDAGHECTLIVPAAIDARAPHVWTLRSPKLPNGTGYRIILRRRAVLALLDELRPDVLEVHDKVLQLWVWAWSRARGVPVVAWSHERLDQTLPLLAPFLPGGAVRRATSALTRRTADRCDVLIACSRFAAAEFGPYAPVRVVPLGVDLDTYQPPSHAAGTGPLRLVLAVRLSPEKRPDLALDALRVLADRGVDAELTVLGHGQHHARLAAQATGLPVRFTGYLADRTAVAAELGAADVALAPAPAETFGLAALEALACGTPVVAHAGAAPAEMVARHADAGRIAAGNGGAFADAARALAAVARAPRRDAARRAAEAYPWTATITTMLDVHTRLAGEAAAGRIVRA
jgi:alpha-1,6-mannosyltransferase